MEEANKMQFGEELKKRTKLFALRIIGVVRALPGSQEGRLMSGQIWRCGTAVGSNYRATCRSRSAKEFIARIGVVIEEADETLYWLEVIVESKMLRATLLKSLIMEAEELLHIFSKSQSTARLNLANTKKKGKNTP